MYGRSLVSPAHAAQLEEHARRMRFAQTASEHLLWCSLSGSKTGYPFRRQLVIARYIVDFASTKVRLVVEVDGGYHENRQQHDTARDRALALLGWRTHRVTEQDVLSDLARVVAGIVVAASQPR